MRSDVCQSPLQYPVKCGFIARRQFRLQPVGAEAYPKSGSGGELARIQSNHWYKPLLVPDGRTQIEYKVADSLQSVFDQRNRLPQLTAELVDGAFLQIEGHDLGVKLQNNKVVADLVVKVLGQPASLLLVCVAQFGRNDLRTVFRQCSSLLQSLPLGGSMFGVAG